MFNDSKSFVDSLIDITLKAVATKCIGAQPAALTVLLTSKPDLSKNSTTSIPLSFTRYLKKFGNPSIFIVIKKLKLTKQLLKLENMVQDYAC